MSDALYTKELVQTKMRTLNLGGHVGFDILPDQLVNKAVAVGFAFNILCIGKLYSFSILPFFSAVGHSIFLCILNIKKYLGII